MGTRGIIAFHHKDQTKATYNHFDSYPEGLGVDMLAFLRSAADIDALRESVANLQVVSDDVPPTSEQIEALAQYAKRNVGTQTLDDWYVLLRETQGDPAAILTAGYIEDQFGFGYDSLFCEWGYVIDLDTENFDVYRGFNKTSKAEGLWMDASKAREGNYGPITRVASFSFNDLPDDAAFVATVDPSDEA